VIVAPSEQVNKELLWQLAVYDMAGMDPHHGQHRAIEAMAKARFTVLVCGRRFGKTRAVAMRCIAELLRPDRRIWVVAPTHDLTRRVWRAMKPVLLKKVLPSLPQWGLVQPRIVRDIDSAQGRELELSNGSFIAAKSADNLTSLLGEGLDLAVLDESARMTEEAWSSAILPALLDRRGKAVLATTPLGYDWNEELFGFGQDPEMPEWASLRSPSWENTHLPADAIESLKRTMSTQTYKQEICAEFCQRTGAVFADFDRAKHLETVEFVDRWPVMVGIDWGYRNFAVIAAQVDPDGGELRIFDELLLENVTTGDALEAIRRKPWASRIQMFCPDPAGVGTNMHTGQTDIAMLRAAFPRAEVRYSHRPEHRSPEWRAARIRDELMRCTGERRIVVDHGCRAVISMFERAHYSERGLETLVKDSTTHMMDALGYLIVGTQHLEAPRIMARKPF